MKKFYGIIILITLLIAIVILVVSLRSVGVTWGAETCPDSGGWTKVDSGDLSSYPVDGATEYCFKAGPFLTDEIPQGGFGQDGACEESHIERCDLSHWSYFIPRTTPTLTPTNTPTITPTGSLTPTVTVTPSPTGVSETPSVTPTPTREVSIPAFAPETGGR